MTRAHFDTYRGAFATFRACVDGQTAAAKSALPAGRKTCRRCSHSDADRRQAAPQYAAYYVDFLRKNGGASSDCQAK